MQYSFHFSSTGHAEPVGGIGGSTRRLDQSLVRSTWTASISQFDPDQPFAQVHVVCDDELTIEQANDIGREINRQLFGEDQFDSLLIHTGAPDEPVGAAPAPTAVCLECGALDGGHETWCSLYEP